MCLSSSPIGRDNGFYSKPKSVMNTGAREGQAVPVSYKTPAVLLIVQFVKKNFGDREKKNSNMTCFIGYINNTMMKLTIYFISHMRIDEQIINIIPW